MTTRRWIIAIAVMAGLSGGLRGLSDLRDYLNLRRALRLAHARRMEYLAQEHRAAERVARRAGRSTEADRLRDQAAELDRKAAVDWAQR